MQPEEHRSDGSEMTQACVGDRTQMRIYQTALANCFAMLLYTWQIARMTKTLISSNLGTSSSI